MNEARQLFEEKYGDQFDLVDVCYADGDLFDETCYFTCCVNIIHFLFLATKKTVPNEYVLIGRGVDSTQYNDPWFSHSVVKQDKLFHPFPKYVKVFDNDPYNDYYLFIKEKLMKDDKFVSEYKLKAGDDEWSQFYWILNYLGKREVKLR